MQVHPVKQLKTGFQLYGGYSGNYLNINIRDLKLEKLLKKMKMHPLFASSFMFEFLELSLRFAFYQNRIFKRVLNRLWLSEIFIGFRANFDINFKRLFSFLVTKFEMNFRFVRLDLGCHIKCNVWQGQNFTHAVRKPPHPCRLLALKAMPCVPPKYRVFPLVLMNLHKTSQFYLPKTSNN